VLGFGCLCVSAIVVVWFEWIGDVDFDSAVYFVCYLLCRFGCEFQLLCCVLIEAVNLGFMIICAGFGSCVRLMNFGLPWVLFLLLLFCTCFVFAGLWID